MSELLDCVEVTKLSYGDLRRLAILCRELRKEAGIELTSVRSFEATVVEELLNMDKDVPNIPMASYKRTPHGRKDVLFMFSHQFHNLRVQNRSSIMTQDSPTFCDNLTQSKWTIKVYSKGLKRSADKHLRCILSRRARDSGSKEQSVVGLQIFMDFGDRNHKANPVVFSHYTPRDNMQSSDIGSAWGPVVLDSPFYIPRESPVTLRAMIYFKPRDLD